MKRITPLEKFIQDIKPYPDMQYRSILDLLKGYIEINSHYMPAWELMKLKNCIEKALQERIKYEECALRTAKINLPYVIRFLQTGHAEDIKIQTRNLEELLENIKKCEPYDEAWLARQYWEVDNGN